MTGEQPPELDKVFGSAFVRLGLVLAALLAGYLIYQHATRPALEVISANEVRLHMRHDGHYHISGAINGTPVRFMVDTGASMVSVSQAVAQRAGLKCDQPATFTTANGRIRGCVAQREEVEFGGYRVFDIDIAIMPNMDDVALLGMNALARFHLEQSDRTLVIRHKQPE